MGEGEKLIKVARVVESLNQDLVLIMVANDQDHHDQDTKDCTEDTSAVLGVFKSMFDCRAPGIVVITSETQRNCRSIL